MDASVSPPSPDASALSLETIQRELVVLIGQDGLRKWPLATLYAPSIATYDIRHLSAGGSGGGFIRTCFRELRDLFLEAAYSIRSSVAPANVDVLMLAMEARQASNHCPLAIWLEQNSIKCALLSGAQRRAAPIEGADAPVLFAESVGGLCVYFRGIWEAMKLLYAWRSSAGQSPERAWLLKNLQRRAGEGGRLFARAAGILDRLNPGIVVSCDDCDPRARSVLLEARRRGIPTLVIQFGMAGPYHVEWGYLAADTVAVLGLQQLSELIAHGIPSSRLVVTGAPRFDSAASSRSRNRQKVVLFASQPDAAGCFGGEKRRIGLIKEIYTSIRLAGTEVLIRPHPDENMDLHLKLISEMGIRGRISLAAHQSALDALAECGAVVTFHSTLAIEAALAGLPVVFYRPVGSVASPAAEEFVDAAVKEGWACIAEGCEQLATLLGNDELWSKGAGSVDKISYNSDAGATERVGRLVLSLLGQR